MPKVSGWRVSLPGIPPAGVVMDPISKAVAVDRKEYPPISSRLQNRLVEVSNLSALSLLRITAAAQPGSALL